MLQQNDVLPRVYDVDPDALAAFIERAGERRHKAIKISFRGRQGWSKDIGRYTKDSDGKVVQQTILAGS